MPIGTLGAFISLKDPLPDRRALFDVGASGPLAGFLIAVPVLILGAFLTGMVAQPVPHLGQPDLFLDVPFTVESSASGSQLLRIDAPTAGAVTLTIHALESGGATYDGAARITLANGTVLKDKFEAKLKAGHTELRTIAVPENATNATVKVTWDDGLVQFGDPLLVVLLNGFFHNDAYLTHPTFFAGWVGLLVTGINLLPASQLDGGHVARAVFGERMRYVAYLAVAALIYLAVRFQSWMLMAVFILLMGVQHPPPLNDRTGLGLKRQILAVVVLLVFALTFIPRPLIA
jgi:membrane-associated protease RseP (regulator of RpoE activity)